MHNKGFYKKFIKRQMDLAFSIVVLIVLLPLLLIIGILVKIKLGGPIIFKQQRPGLNEKIFYLYKFRTMTNQKDEKGDLLPDEIRLTDFGKLLRSTSLDELPSLINIIKGDMSIVGPRPLLVKYLPLYNENQKRRHEVRPGLTGLAQVSGRNAISWNKKFEYDIKYVDSVTFFKDIYIILLTMKRVLFREGVSSTKSVTMEEFKGNDQ